MVMCAKLGKELPGMPYKPFDNELGQRIYDTISMEAWRSWLEFSKMILNEYRLELNTPTAFKLLMGEAEKFFFGQGAEAPPDYKPPESA